MHTHTKFILACAGLLLAIVASTASAQLNVQLDEYGNGFLNGGLLPFVPSAPDPISGQFTLMYQLPFNVVRGDLILTEGNAVPPGLSDIVRFDNNAAGGVVYFFSDPPDPNETPVPFADTGLPPLTTLPSVILPELGPEGNNGATYFAAIGSPGSAILTTGQISPVTYSILSDTPEPATLSLLALGGLAILRLRRRK